MISLVIIVIMVCYFYSKHCKRTKLSKGAQITDDLEDLRESVNSNSSSFDSKGNVSNDKTVTPVHLYAYD